MIAVNVLSGVLTGLLLIGCTGIVAVASYQRQAPQTAPAELEPAQTRSSELARTGVAQRPSEVTSAVGAEGSPIRVVYLGSAPTFAAKPPVEQPLAIIALRDEAAPPTPVVPAGSSEIETASAIDLNTAPLEDLNHLGAGLIGRAIIRGRPYTSTDDLLNKRVLNRAAFDKVRSQVAVR
jgi:DNA uptake protein ComE-like DNA-binding protein